MKTSSLLAETVTAGQWFIYTSVDWAILFWSYFTKTLECLYIAFHLFFSQGYTSIITFIKEEQCHLRENNTIASCYSLYLYIFIIRQNSLWRQLGHITNKSRVHNKWSKIPERNKHRTLVMRVVSESVRLLHICIIFTFCIS
jgi:hypothetical protein